MTIDTLSNRVHAGNPTDIEDRQRGQEAISDSQCSATKGGFRVCAVQACCGEATWNAVKRQLFLWGVNHEWTRMMGRSRQWTGLGRRFDVSDRFFHPDWLRCSRRNRRGGLAHAKTRRETQGDVVCSGTTTGGYARRGWSSLKGARAGKPELREGREGDGWGTCQETRTNCSSSLVGETLMAVPSF